MAQIFTGWSFDKALDKSIDRKNQVKQFEEVQNQRYIELAERITAREAADAYREKALKEEILHRQKAQEIQMRGQDINRDLSQQKLNESQRQFEVSRHDAIRNREDIQAEAVKAREDVQAEDRWKYKEGKTREEREKKALSKVVTGAIPNFDEMGDKSGADLEEGDVFGNPGIFDVITGGEFDEGEFSRSSRGYVDNIEMNMQALANEAKYNPGSPQLNRHIEDLKSMQKILDSGEYSGILDSSVFNWFEGATTSNDGTGYGKGLASDAKKTSQRIDRLLNVLGK